MISKYEWHDYAGYLHTFPSPDCSTGGGCSAVRIRRHTAGPAGVSVVLGAPDRNTVSVIVEPRFHIVLSGLSSRSTLRRSLYSAYQAPRHGLSATAAVPSDHCGTGRFCTVACKPTPTVFPSALASARTASATID